MTCEVPGCDKPMKWKRVCAMHYMRMQRHGTYAGGRVVHGSPFDRLMRNVEKRDDGCWIFVGKSRKNGYACVGAGGDSAPSLYGHRVAYEALVGPIPADRPRLHHTCEERLCVNPDHLEPVSAAEHARRHLR